MPEAKIYIGTKVIKAFSLDRISYLKSQKKDVDENQENEHGYQVEYPDGYISWSPKEAFENAYRVITDSERKLISR